MSEALTRALVLDIEGTTSSLSFVKDELFPYARARLPAYVTEHVQTLSALLDDVRRIEGNAALDTQQLIATLLRWIGEDRKLTPLKSLQGLIWQEGYERGELHGHVYEDAVEALRAWHAAGLKLYIYSSGSVLAQRLIFSHTEYGDLTPYFSGYFDTAIGGKLEPESYRAIAARIGLPPAAVLFLSDHSGEISAAAIAGMQVIQVCRDPAAEATRDRTRIASFAELKPPGASAQKPRGSPGGVPHAHGGNDRGLPLGSQHARPAGWERQRRVAHARSGRWQSQSGLHCGGAGRLARRQAGAALCAPGGQQLAVAAVALALRAPRARGAGAMGTGVRAWLVPRRFSHGAHCHGVPEPPHRAAQRVRPRRTYPLVGRHLGTFLARTLFHTSDLYLTAAVKKERIGAFLGNSAMCKISEDLIFDEPYFSAPLNRHTRPQLDALAESVRRDTPLKLAVQELKARFLSDAEALLHGDLHTGSVLVTRGDTRVIDPEFAFYGPMGFDLGAIIGNFLLAHASQRGHERTRGERDDYRTICSRKSATCGRLSRKYLPTCGASTHRAIFIRSDSSERCARAARAGHLAPAPVDLGSVGGLCGLQDDPPHPWACACRGFRVHWRPGTASGCERARQGLPAICCSIEAPMGMWRRSSGPRGSTHESA
jgi:enolase-phosphatase E1